MQIYQKNIKINIFAHIKTIKNFKIMRDMQILLTNDDGYRAEGIKMLSKIMSNYGKVTVVAPKEHQSGMAVAVDLGLKPLAYKNLGEIDGADWSYLGGTPASCIKFGLNFPFKDKKPDIVMSGINHGSNATMGSLYSGTLGAAMEATLNGILAIGVSLDDFFTQEPDFSAFEHYLPMILDKLIANRADHEGVYYNINFPAIPTEKIKGVVVARQGHGHWEKEFTEWNPEQWAKKGLTPETLGRKAAAQAEEGEEMYMMIGNFVDDDKDSMADHHKLAEGYITIVAHNIYSTDLEETERLRSLGLNIEF